MDNIKAWYHSKTIWGAMLAIGAPLFNVFGFDVPGEVQNQLADIAVTLAGAIGGLIALYGRLSATKALK